MARSIHIILMKRIFTHTETDSNGHWGAVQGIRHEKAPNDVMVGRFDTHGIELDWIFLHN